VPQPELLGNEEPTIPIGDAHRCSCGKSDES
jgi:hypothetical protein